MELHLNNNRLGRTLPDAFQNLVNLEALVLSGNEFTGRIPPSWRALRRLRRLEVQDNDMEFDVDKRFCAAARIGGRCAVAAQSASHRLYYRWEGLAGVGLAGIIQVARTFIWVARGGN